MHYKWSKYTKIYRKLIKERNRILYPKLIKAQLIIYKTIFSNYMSYLILQASW